MGCQAKRAISQPDVFCGPGYHCLQSLKIPKRDKVHQTITPSHPWWVHEVALALAGSCFIKQESDTEAALECVRQPELPCNTSKESQPAYMEDSNEKNSTSPAASDSAGKESYMIE